MTVHLDVEKRLLATGGLVVAGMDEVGRGAIAGPVTVGVVAVAAPLPAVPVGLRDSKQLTPRARVHMAAKLATFGIDRAVASATAGEIDAVGIVGALRLAGLRALALLAARGVRPGALILDGSHNWLQASTLADAFVAEEPFAGEVEMLVKADTKCASVAAASVLAKVWRDNYMIAAAATHYGYGWERNKGYAASEHQNGISQLGLCAEHRRSWRIRGPQSTAVDMS